MAAAAAGRRWLRRRPAGCAEVGQSPSSLPALSRSPETEVVFSTRLWSRLLRPFVVAGGRRGSDPRAPSPDPCLPWPDLGRRGTPPPRHLGFAFPFAAGRWECCLLGSWPLGPPSPSSAPSHRSPRSPAVGCRGLGARPGAPPHCWCPGGARGHFWPFCGWCRRPSIAHCRCGLPMARRGGSHPMDG